jgi:uncharacterized membrane protein YebE (DUF533 family)
MESGNLRYLLSYHEGYYQSGSSEIKSWIAMIGALRGTYLKGQFGGVHALAAVGAVVGAALAANKSEQMFAAKAAPTAAPTTAPTIACSDETADGIPRTAGTSFR